MDINHIDELAMYMGEDFVINEHITVRQPTLGDIIAFGEETYFRVVHSLCAIPSDLKSVLWDKQIDYEEISDFELFVMLARTLKKEDTKLLLGDMDLSQMQLGMNDENQELVLIDTEKGFVIDKLVYLRIVQYIRKMHGLVPKIERAGNAYTKQILIEEDRSNIELSAKKVYRSKLLPLISSMVNSAGFKYKKQELKEVGLVEFMDSVQRISIISNAAALLNGCYSGMIDTKKINKKDLNWMQELGSE